jgi:actin-related protein
LETHILLHVLVDSSAKKKKKNCRFAAGKGTAVVVDIGDDLTTVTPISDGFVLRKGRKSFTV